MAFSFGHCRLCSKFSSFLCLLFLCQTLTLMNLSFFLVDKATFMVGSYGPRPEEYEFLTPTEEAPKGMLARGTYHNKSFFTDDDKHDHLTWEWNLSIKKEWTEWAHPPIPFPTSPSRSTLSVTFTTLALLPVHSWIPSPMRPTFYYQHILSCNVSNGP